jgi:tetratricopeptide (TPR) repeat protein
MVHLYEIPPDAVLQDVLEVYERGQTVDAQRRAETFAPLRLWGGVEGAVMASRIAANTGAPRLAVRLSIRAWRTDPDHPQAQLQYGFQLAYMRGPLALWEAMLGWPESQGASSDEQAELLALKAGAAADLRDFDTAEAFLDRAESLAPAVAWVRLQRAHLLERQDRVEEALEIAEAACALHPHPFYRPGVQTCAYLLQLLDRDQDAIQLLRDADAVLQNGPLAAQRYALLSENGCWSEAEAALSRFITFSPLIERPVQKWLLAQQARVSYHLGQRSDAMRFASALEDDFHRTFTERLSAIPAGPERVQLDVTFVRQHFKTCAPATLAAIGRYWRMPADHLKLAEAMCYDGTPSWQQRDWAEQNGWYVREFRMDEESAVALITRGVPVAVTTVEATSAHMMALVGFDRTRGTLLFRDPALPYIIEAPAKEFLERYRAFGPHGVVFLPLREQGRMEDVTLPDAEIYDEYHRFSLALTRYDRVGAADILQRTEHAFPGHELTWGMRLDFASYDANITEQAQCVDKLLERFPSNAALLFRRLACLRDGPREERITFLEKACAAKDADPALFIELARAMEVDARCLRQSRRWLKRARRFLPMDSNTASVQADLAWEEGRLEEATNLYRFAANLEGFREELYQSWFVACRRTRHMDEAMTHLQDRFVRFGRRSEQPALTLAWAWREMEQPDRAREVLIEAARLRPDDGILFLRSASFVASLGDTAETARLLRAARNKVRENDWLRMAAETAELQQDSRGALRWAWDLLQLEPLALDAHGCVARTLARLEGPTAALAHLKEACTRLPHHYGLRRMLMEWTREAGPDDAEATARDLIRLAPSDAWAQRELAMTLSNAGRHEEALNVAIESARIEPRNSYSFSLLGRIYQRLQRRSEADVQFRRAVELSADNSDALRALLELAQTDQERKEELAFIERQLVQQVVTGDGVLAFLELGRPVLDSETLLGTLREAHGERPDLWHAWAALVSQLGHLKRLDEALAVAEEATVRFPHLPRIWLDLADVHRWRNEPEAEIAAAARAFEINPSWDRSAITLAGGFEREGKLDEARHVYERALHHAGTNPCLHACQAHVLWRQQRKPEAFAAIRTPRRPGSSAEAGRALHRGLGFKNRSARYRGAI